MPKIPPRFDMSIRIWRGIRAQALIYLVPAGSLALGCLLLLPWPILLRLLGALACVILGIVGAFLRLQGLGVSGWLKVLVVFLARPRGRVWRRGAPLARQEIAFGETGALWQRLLLAGTGLLLVLLALLLLWPSREQVVAAVISGPTPTPVPIFTPTPSSPMVDVDEITSREWYLTDGDSRSGTEWGDFDTWVLLMNPQETASRVTVEFISTTGERLTRTYDLLPQSRKNIWVDQIMPERQMSTIIHATSPIMAERALFWGGAWGTLITWKSAAGQGMVFRGWCSEREGEVFSDHLEPSEQEAHLVLRFVRQGVLGTSEGVLGPRSVMRLDVSTFGLPSGPVALILESDVGVVAERSTYWGKGGGHSTVGASEPSGKWYFAEGNMAGGQVHFAVLNPTPEDSRVFFHFYMELEGREERVQLEVPAFSRVTLLAEEIESLVGAFATVVRASTPVVVERTMYTEEYGHSTVGAPEGQKVWYLAEGCTDWPYTDYIYIFNPGKREAAVQVVMMDNEGQLRTLSGDIPPCDRWVLYANEVWTTLFSTKVISSEPVVCERVMGIVRGGMTSSLGVGRQKEIGVE